MEITYQIEVLNEDIPVRGNAMCSGDEATDKEAEDEILRRLDHGDFWAWCTIRVTALVDHKGQQFVGMAYLGCSSYEDERGFSSDGFPQMKDEARADLLSCLRAEISRAEAAREILAGLL